MLFNFERGEYYHSTSAKKKEKVHACCPRRKAGFFTCRRRYRMISPFLFFKKTYEGAILCLDGGCAGRSEDGACLRL
jgi:hypothetical protein